jgi:methylthioribose-1-phosphate isomerase
MRAAQSPLFEPVLWDGDGFKILDETSLPEKIEYISVHEVAQALDAVREMKTRAFGQVLTLLYSGGLIARDYQGGDPEGLRQKLAQMTQEFCAVRPTFDFKGIGIFFTRWFAELPRGVAVGEWIAGRARTCVTEIMQARRARAQRMASLLPDSARVLTHCNISGELVAVAQYCKEAGKQFSVIATETRPYLQGTRLTAWELAQAGVAVAVIPDCAVAQVLARGEANAVIVGADRCAQNGDVINKVGTYPLALMAKAYDVPFYALVQEPGSLARGEDAAIEERGADELLLFQGHSVVGDGAEQIAARYPAFDVTPSPLITKWVGFDDVFTPESFRKKYFTNPSVTEGCEKTPRRRYLLVYGMPGKNSHAFLKHALTAEQAESILVPEMRPELWGARRLAPELWQRGAAPTLISDNMMGTLFAQEEIRMLYLFYDGLSEQGLSAPCGSLLAVRLARHHGVPIELQEAEQHKESPVDRDVATFLGRPILPPGVSVHTVQKELIPWSLLKEDKATVS